MAYSLDVHSRKYNISLWRCDVDAVWTAGISSLTQLQELSLRSGDDMSDNFFQALSKLTSLKSIEFSMCEYITDDDLIYFHILKN